MSSIEVIEQRVSVIKQYLATLLGYKKYSRSEIESNETVRHALERVLYLVAQASIDLAEEVVALKDLRKPTSYSEAFDILCEAKLVSSDLADRLVKMSGFRNIIAHDYLKLDYDKVYDVLHNRLSDIEEFIIEAQKLF